MSSNNKIQLKQKQMGINARNNVSYLDTKLEKDFQQNTTKEAFQEKANHLKWFIDEDQLTVFNDYCQKVCNILDNTPLEAANDERVLEVINNETDNVFDQFKRQRVYASTKVKLAIHDSENNAANDDNFSAAA